MNEILDQNDEKMINSNLEQLKSKYIELMSQKDIQDKYKKYKDIVLNEIWFKDLSDNYSNIKKKQNENDDLEKKLLFDRKLLSKNISNNIKKSENLSNSKYSNLSIDDDISRLNNEKQKLKKHSFLNRKKIKNIDIDIDKLIIKKRLEEQKYNSNKKEELIKLDFELEVLKSSLHDIDFELNEIIRKRNNINQEFEQIENKLDEYYGCREIEKIENIILEAKEYINNNKIEYDYNLDLKIEEIKKLINNLENQLQNIKTNESSFGR